MQPIGGEEQKKANGFASTGLGLASSSSGNNNSSNGTPSKPAEGGALGEMNFNFTPFGQPTSNSNVTLGQSSMTGAVGSTSTASAPAKRPSIDESWVNVDWNEVNRNKSEQQQPPPPKSPKIEAAAPAASVLHPPSLRGLSSFTPQKETSSSFGFGGGFEKKDSFSPSKPAASATTPSSSSLFNLPKPMGHEEKPASGVTATAPKSPTTKPMTPAKEPASLKTESSISAIPKPTPPPAGLKSDNTQSSFKPTTATPAKVEEKPASVQAAVTPKSTTEPVKSQAATLAVASTVTKPSIPSTPTAKPSVPSIPPLAAAPSPAKAKIDEDEASTSKSTPKAKTPRKSTQATPTTPRSSGRTRKTVDRLSPGGMDLHHEPKALEIPAGSGSKFGDIPHVAKELGKHKSDYQPIVTLHRVIFGRPGEAAKRKGNLRGFHGMVSGEDMTKIAEKLSHHQVDELREICGLLNLEHSGEKKSLAERIAKYLMKPTDLGESKPSPRRTTPQKRGKGSPASAKKGKRGGAGKANKATTGKASEQEEEEEGGAESGSEGDDAVIADLEEGQEGAAAAQ